MSKKGFTLIELIVALAIVMIIVVVIGSTMLRVLETHARISKERILIEEANDFVSYFTFLVRLGSMDPLHTDPAKEALAFTNHALQNKGPYQINPEEITVGTQKVNTLIKTPYTSQLSTQPPLSAEEPLLSPQVFVKHINFEVSPKQKELHPLLTYTMTLGLVSDPSITTTIHSSISLRPFDAQ